MVSIAVVNAVLNAILWALHAFLAYLIESIYVMSAKLELFHRGFTRATDTNETDAVRWTVKLLLPHSKEGSIRRRCWNSGPCGTTPWAVGLMISGLLFLPAELVAETGIDIREPCGMALVNTTNGVCASRSYSGTAVGIAANSLFIQRVQWLDPNWDAIFEGSSRNMVRHEVRDLKSVSDVFQNEAKALGCNCSSMAISCTQCGTVIVTKSKGLFGAEVTNASLLKGNSEYPFRQSNETNQYGSRGYVTSDGKLFAAFVFQESDILRVTSTQTGSDIKALNKVEIEGVETLLSISEYRAILALDAEPLKLTLDPMRTRKYNISCFLSGVTPPQMVMSTAIYRMMQLERPSFVRPKNVASLSEFAPITNSDALKAVFALMSDDRRVSCSRRVPVYGSCGIYHWKPAVFMGAISIMSVVAWGTLYWFSRGLDDHLPYDSSSWRSYALDDHSNRKVRAEVRKVGTRRRIVVVNNRENEEEGQWTGTS